MLHERYFEAGQSGGRVGELTLTQPPCSSATVMLSKLSTFMFNYILAVGIVGFPAYWLMQVNLAKRSQLKSARTVNAIPGTRD